MHWQLLLEEYAPEFHHIQGKHNIVADALSHLTWYKTDRQEQDYNSCILAKCYDMEGQTTP